MKHYTIIAILLLRSIASTIYAQQTVHYDLAGLLNDGKLIIDTSNHAQVLSDNSYTKAISLKKIAWLKNASFTNGMIEIDLRGKDVFLQSFLGIAFHASDSNHYELVYFRPFNFEHVDTARRRWSLQYMYVPDYEWPKLRKEHPLVYENSITPPPKADAWFHAAIVVTDDSVKVYVNHALTPSLQVKRLVNIKTGMIGLWDDELSGDFANLTIQQTDQ